MKKLFETLQQSSRIQKFLLLGNYLFLFFYIFSIPAFSARPVFYLISYILMVFLAIFAILYMLIYKKIKFKPRLFIILIFVFWSLFGTILFSHEYRSWLTLFLLSVTYFIFYITFNNINDLFKILKIICTALCFFSFYFIFHYRSNILNNLMGGGSERLGDYFDNVNAIGSIMSIGVYCSLYISLFHTKKRELIFLFPFSIFTLIGYLTGSRTFIISLLVAILLFLFLKMKNHKLVFIISLISVVALFFVIINLKPLAFIKSQFQKTFYTIFGIGDSSTTSIDNSSKTRILWQLYAYNLGSKNLIFGYGANGFAIFSGVGTYSHGNFCELVCNFGAIGLILFYLTYIISLFCFFRTKNANKWFVIPILFLVLCKTILAVDYNGKATYILLALISFCIDDVVLFNKRTFNSCENMEIQI